VFPRAFRWLVPSVLLVLLVAPPANAVKYRWPVKTGTDAAAKLAHPTKDSTVEALAKLTRPAGIKTTTKRLSPLRADDLHRSREATLLPPRGRR
jgi:hypothetical protein